MIGAVCYYLPLVTIKLENEAPFMEILKSELFCSRFISPRRWDELINFSHGLDVSTFPNGTAVPSKANMSDCLPCEKVALQRHSSQYIIPALILLGEECQVLWHMRGAPSDFWRSRLRRYPLRQQHLRHMKCRERRHLKRQQLCPLNYKLIQRGPRQLLNHLLGFLGREVKKQFQRCNLLWWCSPANTGLGEVYLWIQQCMTNNTLQPPWWVMNSFDGPSFGRHIP